MFPVQHNVPRWLGSLGCTCEIEGIEVNLIKERWASQGSEVNAHTSTRKDTQIHYILWSPTGLMYPQRVNFARKGWSRSKEQCNSILFLPSIV